MSTSDEGDTGSQIDRRTLLALAAGATVSPKALAAQPVAVRPNLEGPYDVVILNGRVIDPETGLDARRTVGITGGRIAAISEQQLTGATELNAEGHIVAPGFIDLHAHSQTQPGAWMQVYDGVTTALELESGILPVAKFYDDSAREGRPNNFGAASAWTFARIQALNGLEPDATLDVFQQAFAFPEWQNDLATQEQLALILDLIEGGLREGGLGIGINGGYAPAYGRKEYYELAKLAARYDVPTFTHVRYASNIEPLSAFEAIQELIALAATTGAHMHICHLNSTSGRDIDDIVEMMQNAQARGVPITTEAYPYGAASTAVGAAMFRGEDWDLRMGSRYGEGIYLELAGDRLSYEEVIQLQQTEPGAAVVFHFLDPDQSDEDQRLLDSSILYPGAAICSDSVPWTDAQGLFISGTDWPLPEGAFSHPRSAGSYARFFREYVRERGAVDLKEAVAKCTLYPAQIMEATVPQMRTRGRMQVGADADVVVFNLDTIRDNATFLDPVQTSTGFRHVLVNGVAVIEEGERMGDRLPGRGIRRAVRG